jgi:hypothetical protein
MNSSDACQANTAELLTLSDTTDIQSIKKTFNENKRYFDHIQRGTWIGKNTKDLSINTEGWEKHLCDNTSTIEEDLQLNCVILTIHSDNQTLCLKKVSCIEHHPFICQSD